MIAGLEPSHAEPQNCAGTSIPRRTSPAPVQPEGDFPCNGKHRPRLTSALALKSRCTFRTADPKLLIHPPASAEATGRKSGVFTGTPACASRFSARPLAAVSRSGTAIAAIAQGYAPAVSRPNRAPNLRFSCRPTPAMKACCSTPRQTSSNKFAATPPCSHAARCATRRLPVWC